MDRPKYLREAIAQGWTWGTKPIPLWERMWLLDYRKHETKAHRFWKEVKARRELFKTEERPFIVGRIVDYFEERQGKEGRTMARKCLRGKGQASLATIEKELSWIVQEYEWENP